MKVVFIAGPFRGPKPWDVEQNVRRAEELALRVAERGAMPLCPHTNTRFFDRLLTDEFWLEGTSELLRRCDGIAFVDGWQSSEGARAERALAKSLGLRIFESHMCLAGLRDWALAPPLKRA